jgi:hypothetical protein
VSALLTQLPRTHKLLILGKCEREEEREFYLRPASVQRWSRRELERRINTGLFERLVLSRKKLAAPLRELHPDDAETLNDAVRTMRIGFACPSVENCNEDWNGRSTSGHRVASRLMNSRNEYWVAWENNASVQHG